MKAVSPDRWQASQKLELEFWKHWKEATPYQNLDLPEYWKGELSRFGYGREMFSGRRVMDIGCGPFGLIHFLDNAKARVRIDPLLPQYESKMMLPEPQLSLAALGEPSPGFEVDGCCDLFQRFGSYARSGGRNARDQAGPSTRGQPAADEPYVSLVDPAVLLDGPFASTSLDCLRFRGAGGQHVRRCLGGAFAPPIQSSFPEVDSALFVEVPGWEPRGFNDLRAGPYSAPIDDQN